MGPAAPSLSAYQQAAQSIYEPQKQADITLLRANTAADAANLEGSKGQIQTDYQTAIDNLTAQTNKNVGTINQLYTERLGGNFSGLQGNDLGMMFSNANKQQSFIESTRANKLASISLTEANDQNKEIANESAIGSRYKGQEAEYANKSYDAATKEYATQNQQAFTDQLALERLGLERQRLTQSNKDKTPEYTVKQGSQGQHLFSDKSGQPVSMAEFIQGNGKSGQDVLDILANGTTYDKQLYKQLKNLNPQSEQELYSAIAKLDKKNYYGFGG